VDLALPNTVRQLFFEFSYCARVPLCDYVIILDKGSAGSRPQLCAVAVSRLTSDRLLQRCSTALPEREKQAEIGGVRHETTPSLSRVIEAKTCRRFVVAWATCQNCTGNYRTKENRLESPLKQEADSGGRF
jgi:hypothetical protein